MLTIHISRNDFFYELEMKQYDEFKQFLDRVETEILAKGDELIVYEKFTKKGFPPREVEVPINRFRDLDSFKEFRQNLESLMDLESKEG